MHFDNKGDLFHNLSDSDWYEIYIIIHIYVQVQDMHFMYIGRGDEKTD